MSLMITMLSAAVGLLFFVWGVVKLSDFRSALAVDTTARGGDRARAALPPSHLHHRVFLVRYAPAAFIAYTPGPDVLGITSETTGDHG